MKILLILTTLFMTSLSFAEVNFGNNLQVGNLIPNAAVTATADGTAIDLKTWDGQIGIVCDVKNVAGTLPTLALKVQDSADNITFADVTGGAFTGITTVASVQKIVLNKDSLNRYIRIVDTIGGTGSPQYLVSVKAYGFLKYKN